MIIEAPNAIPHSPLPIVFLAGSIEMGTAADWQVRAAEALDDIALVLNPRRRDWDSSWVQDITNPPFREQVEWELDGLERARLKLIHFEPEAKAPISLLELGRFGMGRRTFVHCPVGFWRKGNVDIFCFRYQIPMFSSIDDMIAAARGRLLAGDRADEAIASK